MLAYNASIFFYNNKLMLILYASIININASLLKYKYNILKSKILFKKIYILFLNCLHFYQKQIFFQLSHIYK